MKKNDMFSPLDRNEKKLMDDVENDQYVSLADDEFSKYKKMLMAVANHKPKSEVRKPVTFKPDPKVLELFKIKAGNEGIKYQTLLNKIMYKYAVGKLVDKNI